jgi:hypothetical protein
MIVLQAWRRWKPSSLRRIAGDYAFALWDERSAVSRPLSSSKPSIVIFQRITVLRRVGKRKLLYKSSPCSRPQERQAGPKQAIGKSGRP